MKSLVETIYFKHYICMQAIILAAGMGKRLKGLTSENTKCMVKVNGIPMIDRMMGNLDRLELKQIVLVVGYCAEGLMEHVSELNLKTPVVYVNNEIYNKTNNIYSLYLAKDYLLTDDTILLESDLVFEEAVLDKILDNPYPSLALVAKYESWMDGTCLTVDDEDNIVSFHSGDDFSFHDTDHYYKTINIYKFSKEFSQSHYVPFLKAYSAALGHNEYYEQVLKVITLLRKPEIKAVRLEEEQWYEIDNAQDLDIAESIFAESGEEKLALMMRRYGGYWRYPKLADFCYLVNPYFPPKKMIDEMLNNFQRLMMNYPSGQAVNSQLAADYFGVEEEHIALGNGAAELIKSLLEEEVKGKTGIVLPTFEEYPNRLSQSSIVSFRPKNRDFSYTADDLIDFFKDTEIQSLILINPDNPTGNFVHRGDLEKLIQWADKKGILLIVDESFLDFAEGSIVENSLLNGGFLEKNRKLVVVKSISKSYGVPGFRLGILASGDRELIQRIKKEISIWNINSFGEFFMQIAGKYKKDYAAAVTRFKSVRETYAANLANIRGLRPIPSQANYIMFELTNGIKAGKLAEELLQKYSLLIKDLSSKVGDRGEYIRVAVKTEEENQRLIEALTAIMNN